MEEHTQQTILFIVALILIVACVSVPIATSMKGKITFLEWICYFLVAIPIVLIAYFMAVFVARLP